VRAVVVFNGEPVPEDAALLRTADLPVAADGAANWIDRLGMRPNLVVGDLDSIDPDLLHELQEDGVAIDQHPTEKDATDGELALAAAIGAGATAITIVGALGGRTDHALTNLFLLANPALDGIETDVRRGPTTVRLVRPGAAVEGQARPGDLVSLVPVPEAHGVRTSGLRYPLSDEDLSAGSSRGASNVVLDGPYAVRVQSGALFLIEQSQENSR